MATPRHEGTVGSWLVWPRRETTNNVYIDSFKATEDVENLENQHLHPAMALLYLPRSKVVREILKSSFSLELDFLKEHSESWSIYWKKKDLSSFFVSVIIPAERRPSTDIVLWVFFCNVTLINWAWCSACSSLMYWADLRMDTILISLNVLGGLVRLVEASSIQLLITSNWNPEPHRRAADWFLRETTQFFAAKRAPIIDLSIPKEIKSCMMPSTETCCQWVRLSKSKPTGHISIYEIRDQFLFAHRIIGWALTNESWESKNA